MSAIDNQALEWLHIQFERELDANDRAALEAWLEEDVRHRGAYIRAEVIYNAVSKTITHQAAHPGEDRYALRPDELGTQGAGRRTYLKYAAIAASVAALGVGLSMSLPTTHARLATSKGEMKRIALADTSVASINSGSQLEVKLTTKKRQITLVKGEAWFEVAKDKTKPFVVEAGEVQVRAVGTAFGVRRFQNGVEVLVTDGTVEVTSGGARARLSAGQRSFIAYQTAQINVAQQPQEVQRKLAWRDGMLIFTRQTLSEAVADFNRYSVKKILIMDPSLGNRRIFGQYPIDAPEEFAKDIGYYLKVPIEVRADSIMIGVNNQRNKDGSI
jgi:transmembrane sensor